MHGPTYMQFQSTKFQASKQSECIIPDSQVLRKKAKVHNWMHNTIQKGTSLGYALNWTNWQLHELYRAEQCIQVSVDQHRFKRKTQIDFKRYRKHSLLTKEGKVNWFDAYPCSLWSIICKNLVLRLCMCFGIQLSRSDYLPIFSLWVNCENKYAINSCKWLWVIKMQPEKSKCVPSSLQLQQLKRILEYDESQL